MNLNRIFLSGQACLLGGILFAVSLTTMFSLPQFPPTVKLFLEEHKYILRTAFFMSQLGFMAGIYGLLHTQATGLNKFGKILLLVPVLGQLCYAVSAWLPAQQVMTLLPIPLTQLGALLNAVGMLAVGILVVRSGVWQGWSRWTPLWVGLYPFLVMFPLLILSGGRPPSIVIGLWGLFWAILGAKIRQRAPLKQAIAA